MAKNKNIEKDRSIDLLEKMLIFQLYKIKMPQARIAKIIGKKTSWVNTLLKNMPKGDDKNVKRKKTK